MEKAVADLSALEAAQVDTAVATAHDRYTGARLQVLMALAVGLCASSLVEWED